MSPNQGLVNVAEVKPLRFFLHRFTGAPLPRLLVDRYRALNLPGANLAGTWPKTTLRRKINQALAE